MFKKIIVLIYFLSIGLVYLHNLTRDIYSGDVGDLVTAAVLHGVPHPTGYPLFTLLGFILSKIPLSIPPVTKVGLISVFASLAGLIFLYKFSFKVTESVFLSLLTVSILAFSYLFWLHSELPEVFALNNFFVIIILYFAIRFHENGKLKDLYTLTFLIFLSLTHHHTILLLFPSVAFIVLKRFPLITNNKTTIFKLLMCGIAGIAVYIYVPLAAFTNPAVNWDNVVNLNNFIRLILRQDYGGFAPSVINGVPFIVKSIVARNFLKTLVSLYSYQIIVVAFLGAFALYKKDKFLLFTLLFSFVFAGPFFIFYGANVITTTAAWGVNERFYLLASEVFIFFVPYGFKLLKDFIDKRVSNKLLTFVLLAYFLIVPFFLLKYNYPRTDLSKTQIGNNLALDILSFLPKNSVLFVSGDTTSFNLWYVRYALGIRPDVEIVNPGGVGGNIYLDQEINNYYQKYPKTKLTEVIHKTIEKLREKKEIYATYDLKIKIKDSTFVPKGLVYKLTSNNEIQTKEEYLYEVKSQWKKLHLARRETLKLSEQNLVTPEIPLIYSNGLIRVGDYLISKFNDPAESEHYYRRAQWIDPDNPGASAGLGLSLFKAYNDCRESVRQMKQAISIYKIWKLYYLQLYILYDRCGYADQTKNELADLYQNTFNENLLEIVKESK
ncbi:hypothetical protein A2954_05895 [Candidatus Roizmanbacteria bacterium RIFCSPLOWO2_01_FULL_37_12]|uniref:DUF2723 domain-containing protein n=1 Tax=Candidatus Roizmanbacteria bacterium RIFCSPLOWO2_01_FULL_37_12 TaxID=1802056 RepID=A0A1F7IBW2_9BACT|nr:MAG: hypothetical protein A2768_02635 [Candidatus Roizmanbacteria bacterium RIFCSPHIGHO2_01_FULL_37_16]OGK26001.1 MAG: hypothetical protein A3D76_03510 [Candidatus Roizmanbacteria bacterium RIFCSPHIGHO2_02_FULL_37_9b]OGK40838.1 MAG: hypothetical protein A2954_05895 [Candidatus Roizmanbacteria bacterium RIFCSPLOWO2_01_FULL_37_12]